MAKIKAHFIETILAQSVNTPEIPLAFVSSPGMGKDLPLDAPVLTPNGWVRNGDLQVGDLVVARNGKPTKVTGVYPQSVHAFYRITFSDGTSVDCGDEHLWAVFDKFHNGSDNTRGRQRLMTTQDLFESKLYSQEGKWRRWRYYIPMCEPVEFVSDVLKPLLVDPWLLGVLLGDGGILNGMVRFTSVDVEIVRRVMEIVKSYRCYVKPVNGSNIDWTVLDPSAGRSSKNCLHAKLSMYGLCGKRSYEKFVPDAYMFASVEHRIALLQGLMDTDGSVGILGSYEFTSTSLRLAQDVQFMVQSLGGTATLNVKTNSGYRDKEGVFVKCRDSYRLHIKCDIPLVSLSRKTERLRKRNVSVFRQIRSVERIKDQEGLCITVDCPEQLYLTNDCIVTHNTAVIEEYAAKNNLPLVKLLASTLDESDCFIGDTEILTEDGFVRLDTLQENVKVAQVDEYNNVSFVVPSQIVQKPHDGEMVVFKSKRLDVAMTPSHRVAFRPCPVVKDTRHQMPLQIASAREFLTKKGRAYISSGGIASYGNNLSEKQRFHIAFAADGCVLYKHKTTNTFAARFGFSKKRKQVEFERLCCVLGLSFTKGKPRKFDNPKWKDSINYDVIVPNDFVTKDISDIASLDTVSSNFAREALEYISKWDGTRMTSSTMRFSSKKKIDVDYVQALAALCNTRSKIGYDVHVFYVDVTFGKTDVVIEKHHVKSRYYKGDVFCVTVPTGMFIARSNDATFVTGNCAGIVVSTAEKHISQDEHGNLKIVPSADGGAKTLSPDWVKRLRDGGVLLLDELNTARREVQDTLLTLIQSRVLPNGDKLHPNVRIVACMNDFVQCNNYCMSPAMRNRFAWFRVSPNAKQWLGWLKSTVHPDVHAFMTAAFERGMLFSPDDAFMDDSENLFTTPRSLYNLIAFCGGCSKTVIDSLKLVQAIVKYAPNFVDKAAVGVLKSLGADAKKDRSNAVFQAYLDNNSIDGSAVTDITEAVRVNGIDDDEEDESF